MKDDDDDYVNEGTKDGFGTNSVTMLPVVVRNLLSLYRLMATGWTAKVHLQELNWSSSINNEGMVSSYFLC
jgi:spore maturation protein SpmB